jgi:hypothetical protein
MIYLIKALSPALLNLSSSSLNFKASASYLSSFSLLSFAYSKYRTVAKRIKQREIGIRNIINLHASPVKAANIINSISLLFMYNIILGGN